MAPVGTLRCSRFPMGGVSPICWAIRRGKGGKRHHSSLNTDMLAEGLGGSPTHHKKHSGGLRVWTSGGRNPSLVGSRH